MTGDAAPAPGRTIVVMGVSAVGKTTVGRALAARLGSAFIDADDLHPAENVAKMASGTPLVDADRWPWLDAVVDAANAEAAAGTPVVLACSALRRRYRDRIRAGIDVVVFVHLLADREALVERAAGRSEHFMPPSLLASQLATLEPLADDERGLLVEATRPPADVADRIAELLAAR